MDLPMLVFARVDGRVCDGCASDVPGVGARCASERPPIPWAVAPRIARNN